MPLPEKLLSRFAPFAVTAEGPKSKESSTQATNLPAWLRPRPTQMLDHIKPPQTTQPIREIEKNV
jgi:hypothetical protein